MAAVIKHVFVLMMENRSFDHLLGFSGLPGVAAPDERWGMTPGAPDRAPLDPPHEFENVADQIAGSPPMSGFQQQSYWSVSGKAFGPGALPILTRLARQYCLFDNWYASMPGPTWPNRFFVHAGSSGGLDNSPSAATTIASETIDSLSFSFQNDTLFERLAAAGRRWRVYHDDLFPQVLAIKHMVDPFRRNNDQFSAVRDGSRELFVDDLARGYDVDYTFIEPNYGLLSGGFANGNSQHPKGSIAAGEGFIQYIYEGIRNSPVWPQSLLIVTHDEHGGFFDHQNPPGAMPPGDGDQNRGRAQNPQTFAFDRLGVRVPTLAISPWIAQGSLGSQLFLRQSFDHTSLIRTVLDLFGGLPPLTARDAAASSIASIGSLSEMREDPGDTPARLTPAAGALRAADIARPAPAVDPDAEADGMMKGFTRIAMSLDLSRAQERGVTPVAAAHARFSGGPALDAAIVTRAPTLGPRTTSNRESLDYIRSVAEQIRQDRPRL